MERILTHFYQHLASYKKYFPEFTRENLINYPFSFFTPDLHLPVDSKYRPDIDGLRAIAVSAVVLFHAFPNQLTGGFIGVDIFFVISGYLISSIIYNELDTNSFSFVLFYFRRIRRIFPSLIIVLLACYLIGWSLFLPVEYKNLGAHIAAASIFSSNFLLYSESGYFDEATESKPLLHLWSLGIEEQFYIIWPVLIYVTWKNKLNCFTATIVLILCSFVLNIAKMRTDKIQTFYWPTTRAWELLIGACLATRITHVKDFFEHYRTRLDRLLTVIIYIEPIESNGDTLCKVASIVGTLLIGLPMYFLTKTSDFPGWWAAAPTTGTALLIFTGPQAWINRKILCSRLLVRIGRISYPLYLWHWPLLIYSRIFFAQQNAYSTRIVIIFLSVILAWITYDYIEKSFRFGQLPRIKVALLCILMVGVGFMGYQTYRADGLPYRFPLIMGDLSITREPSIMRNSSITPDLRTTQHPQIMDDIINSEKYFKETIASYRHRVCLLNSDQTESNFGSCVDNPEKQLSMGVTLWGDSHAAHLYPGIIARKPVVRVSQLTVGNCAPVIGLTTPKQQYCKQINDYIFKRISDEKPNTVILAAFWFDYQWQSLTDGLKNTIANMKKIPIENIYLVGPVPRWQNALPRCLYDYVSQNKSRLVPHRLHTCLEPSTANLDKVMDAFATENKINYFSPYKVLCNSDGCLTLIEGNDSRLTVYDTDHLTVRASMFVVSYFPNSFLRFLSGT